MIHSTDANGKPEDDKPSEPFIPDFSEGLETGLYLALLELIDEGLIITGDETIIEVNAAACRLLERDYRALVGKPLANLFPSERAFLDARARLLIQGEMRGSLNVALPGGRHRNMRFIAAARIRPGIHALILSHDLVAETYGEAPRADDLWPRLAAALEQPVVVVDALKRIAAINSAAIRLFDIERAALVGKPLAEHIDLAWPAEDAGSLTECRLLTEPAEPRHARVLGGPRPGWHVVILPAPQRLPPTHGPSAPPPPETRPTPDPAEAASTRRALATNQLSVSFQPLVDSRDGRIVAGEALLRWQHPEHGLVPFGEIGGLIHDDSLIAQLSDWALQQACQLAARWPDASGPTLLTVNVSAAQALRGDFVERVGLALERSGLAAERLELDLDERLMLADEDGLLALLAPLDALGVKLAIDDFGRGAVAIPRLKRLPLRALKLDPELVSCVGTDEESESVVEAIATMANVLALEIWARGVDSAPQQAFLAALGYHMQQGPLYGPALSADAFLAHLRKNPSGNREFTRKP
ncbi:MAG: EAL domain-containing protein [Rhodocyclaceae bacterium]